jgi:hypothetical protein
MPDRSGNLIAQSRTPVATAGTAFLIWMITAGAGWPQAASAPPPAPVQPLVQQAMPVQPAPPQGSASPQASPPREDNSGLLNDMTKMFEKSLSVLPTLKSPGEAIDDLNARAKDAAKNAGESLSRLAKPSSMVTGRVMCPVSTNGAPDCKAGADKLCLSKGFKGQEPQFRFRGSLFGESADSRPTTKAGGLPNRPLRHPRAVPVARGAGKPIRGCLLGMMSGILWPSITFPAKSA